MGKSDHGLAGRDDLARIARDVHDDAVGIRLQDGVARLVGDLLFLGKRGGKLGGRRIGQGLVFARRPAW